MKLLSRAEELLLLTIWRLQGDAYGMSIKSKIEEATGSSWSFGAVYAPLNRLLKKGLVHTRKGEPTPERGGKSKVYYTLTPEGKDALITLSKVHENTWTDLPSLLSDRG